MFAGEALSVALGACMPFKAPAHQVRTRLSSNQGEPRIAVAFKARVNVDAAIFKPPPCRGVAQPAGIIVCWFVCFFISFLLDIVKLGGNNAPSVVNGG